MNRKQYEKAKAKWEKNQRNIAAAKRLGNRTIEGYPATHNPYLPHVERDDCYVGCVRPREAR